MARQQITHINGGVINRQEYQAENDMFTELYGMQKTVTSGTPTAGAANTTSVTFTVTDGNGSAVTTTQVLECWISAAATGDSLTTTTASGALTASAGTILTAHTAKKHVTATTTTAGVLTLVLVDSAKTQGERFCCKNPTTGQIVIGTATVTASYGA